MLRSGVNDLSSVILSILRSNFPGTVLPAQASPAVQADLQLGYSLTLALALALLLFRRDPRARVWLGPGLLLFVLVTPVPGITAPLWQHIPPAIQGIAGTWPTQRLLPTLATLAALAGAVALASIGCAGRWRHALPILLGAMLLWSGLEAAKYLRRGYATNLPASLSSHLSRAENSPLLVNWLAFMPSPIPSIYHEGDSFDAHLFNRVWSADRTRIIVDNAAAARDQDRPSVPVTFQPIAPNIWRVLPPLDLKPGQPYLFQPLPNRETLPGRFILSALEFERNTTALAPAGPDIQISFTLSHPNARTGEMVFFPTPQNLTPESVAGALDRKSTRLNSSHT